MEANRDDNMLIYRSADGKIKIDVRFENETVWLTQSQMCVLFGRERSVITKHVKNIFEEKELDENSNVQILHIANSDKPVKFYNLDVIISVGYRVKSQQGTQFRIWATQRLKEYIIKGFALNDERFKTGSSYNYFKELLGRIREIRLSEKVFYQQIKDIYATSIDYDPSAETTLAFFKEVQNKLLWAVSGKTASELQSAMDAGRLLIVSTAPKATRASQTAADERNRYIAELADEIVFGYIAPDSRLHSLYRHYSSKSTILYSQPNPIY